MKGMDGFVKGKYMLFGGTVGDDDDFESAVIEMIALSGTAAPAFLFIGFAQLEPHHGYEYYGELFKKRGCPCDLLTNEDIAGGKASGKIAAADVIFIMGGNTEKLVDTLEKNGLSKDLREAAGRGAVMSGFSAGAICLCRAGMSKNEDYYMQDGIGCLDLLFCPHPKTSERRYRAFLCEMEKRPGDTGAAFDGAGLEIADGMYRAFVFGKDHMASLCRSDGAGCAEKPVSSDWRPASELRPIGR